MFTLEIVASFSASNTKTLNELSPGSDYQAIWECPCQHTYVMRVNHRVNGQSCPYCANRKVKAGFNDLATRNPSLAAEWHPTRNHSLTPENVVYSSDKKVWWQCEKGHEWETKVSLRATGSGCPYCANRKVKAGFNDLATRNPSLAAEWHPTRNMLTVDNVMPGSRAKVWWLGLCGHEWETPVYSRGIQGTKCPYCTGKKVSPEKSLAVTHPHLVEEWSPKNETTPNSYTYGTSTEIWWQCEKGHEWETRIKTRTENKNCPVCAQNSFSSAPEKALAIFLNQFNINLLLNDRKTVGTELDIYVPERNLAIEFNGLYWHDENHKPRNYHYDKWLACKEAGIQLIQVWEDDWNRNPELVKRMIAHKLGVSETHKIYARQTKIVSLTYEKASLFLETNHIQGKVKGNHYLGLVIGDKIVACLVLSVKQNRASIERYATSTHVVGGFTKLLVYIEKTYLTESIETFSDNTVSNGDLYASSGFVISKTLPPDYMYVVQGKRKHKFGYRLKKFQINPNLVYKEGLTEKQLAELNKIPRIWDAGKIKWVKTCDIPESMV